MTEEFRIAFGGVSYHPSGTVCTLIADYWTHGGIRLEGLCGIVLDLMLAGY